jgi:hypothetical protein
MDLKQFKLEVGNNFDEHHLENILYDFHREDKYFIQIRKELLIQGISDSLELHYSDIMSEDKNFILRHTEGKIDIYAISTSVNLIELLLYVSIVNLPKEIQQIKMYSNIIYFIHDTDLIALDIKNSNVSRVEIGLINNYFVYKGIICALNDDKITIINIDKSRYETNFSRLHTYGFRGVFYKNGKVYVRGKEGICIVDIEANSFVIIDSVPRTKSTFPTPHGFFHITSRNIILPSGKLIGVEDLQLPEDRLQSYLRDFDNIRQVPNWFSEVFNTNHNENILICVAQLKSYQDGSKDMVDNMVVLIDLETETVIECINLGKDPKIPGVGFLSPQFLEPIELTTIEFS